MTHETIGSRFPGLVNATYMKPLRDNYFFLF